MKLSSLFILLLALSLTSCKDDCETPPAPATNIVGSWTSNLTGDPVEFKSDGTFIDPEGALLDNGTDNQVKTYVFLSDESIELTTEGNGGSITTEFGFENTRCDEIKFTFLGIPVGFMRVE